ncbi:MAG: hypothetical protein JWP25_6018 [Bradyrhizobium sp.]|nr:hypothetical protein [Bradyrhizobium sp.]
MGGRRCRRRCRSRAAEDCNTIDRHRRIVCVPRSRNCAADSPTRTLVATGFVFVSGQKSARLRGAHTEFVGHTPSWPQFWCFAVIAALLYQSPEAGSSWAAAVCAFAQVSKRATNAVKSSVRGPEPPPRCSRFRCRSRCSIRQRLPRPRLGRLRVSARRRAVPRYRR